MKKVQRKIDAAMKGKDEEIKELKMKVARLDDKVEGLEERLDQYDAEEEVPVAAPRYGGE